MRIINALHHNESIETPLREMAAESDPLRAAFGKMFLALVQYLQSLGSEPVVGAALQLRELIMVRADQRRPAVTVSITWPERAQLVDGLPKMHYLLSAKREGAVLTEEARATTPAEAEAFIHKFLG